MNQPSLFEPTGGELAIKGAESVSSHATPEELFAVDAAIIACSNRFSSFTADDVRAVMGGFDSHPNLMGARILHMARLGVIEPCGFTKAIRAARHGGMMRTWKRRTP